MGEGMGEAGRTGCYLQRIEALREEAQAEGMAINEGSETDFLNFAGIMSEAGAAEAQLVLMDNGNLRALWRGKGSEYLGIQFMGEQRAEYVMARQGKAREGLSREAGSDTLDGVADRAQWLTVRPARAQTGAAAEIQHPPHRR